MIKTAPSSVNRFARYHTLSLAESQLELVRGRQKNILSFNNSITVVSMRLTNGLTFLSRGLCEFLKKSLSCSNGYSRILYVYKKRIQAKTT